MTTNTTTATMKKFEIGKSYFCRSICDWDCIWSYKVIARTASTITLCDEDSKKVIRCRVSKWSREAEEVRPLGSYSMAPILSADYIC